MHVSDVALPRCLQQVLMRSRPGSSVNEIICHGIPDQTVLKDGDTINLDVTLYHKGFHGDL